VDKVNQWLNLYKIPVMLSLVGLVLIVGGVYASGMEGSSSKVSAKQFPKASSSSYQSYEIKVDVSGAVLSPGVYTLNRDSRIEDAIKVAGGFSDRADPGYVSRSLNLSQKLADGQKIYIPFTGEASSYQVTQAAVGVQSASTSITGKVGLNSATPDQLDSLPGVGPVTAGKIISARPYQEVSDLLNKKAVTKSVYEKVKDLVDLN
jgi:competence protein ComEA